MFELESIQKGKLKKPKKIIIYGPVKVGKSTLVGSTENALMIPTEDRVDHIGCDKTPIPNSLEEIFGIIKFLASDKNRSYKRLIIDTVDWLEPLVHDYVCRENGFTSITDDGNKETAFQKGLKYHAVSGWRKLLEGLDYLRDNGIDIILVAHDTVIKVDPPGGDRYDKSVMKIDKNSLSILEEWADSIGYYAREIFVETPSGKRSGKAISSKRRKLYLSGDSAAFTSGNSFGIGDIEIDLAFAGKIMEDLLTCTIPGEPIVIDKAESKSKSKSKEYIKKEEK